MNDPPLTPANVRIDAARLWGTVMETAAIGATDKGGICRLALTDLDREVRDWFRVRCEAAGCTVTVRGATTRCRRSPSAATSTPSRLAANMTA